MIQFFHIGKQGSRMIFIAFLSFFAVIFYAYLAITALSSKPNNPVHRMFFLFSLLFVIWGLGTLFLLADIHPVRTAIWYKISTVCWLILPSAALQMAVADTEFKLIRANRWLPFLIYLPPAIFVYLLFAGTKFLTVYAFNDGDMVEIIERSFWTGVYIFYIAASIVAIAVILIINASRVANNRDRTRFRLMIGGLAVSLACAVVMIVFQHGKFARFALTGGALAMPYVLGLWYAMMKYRSSTLSGETLFRESVKLVKDLLIILDTSDNIIKINPTALELCGYDKSETMGQPFSLLAGDQPWKQCMTGNARSSEVPEEEFSIRCKNGSTIPVHVKCSPLLDTSGDPAGTLLIMSDIRHLKQLEEEITKRRAVDVELRYAYHELGLKHKELEAKQLNLKIRNETMENELAMARKIQMELIPASSPIENLAFFYKPMDKVGGDFYDFIDFPMTEQVGIFVSDVSGHGVPAAFVTTMIKSFIQQFGEYIDSPMDFMFRLNEFLFHKTGGNFITAFYAIFDKKTKEFVYANAGHMAPFVMEKTKIRQLSAEGRGAPLGIFTNQEISLMNKAYEDRRISLKKSSKVLLFTDGLTETANFYDETRLFETEILMKALGDMKNLNARELINSLYESLVAFRQSSSFEDDICIICLETD